MDIPDGGIAFFDSGVGGLTTLHTCVLSCPNATYYYYGDNEHAPYGNLSNAQIRNLAVKIFDMFHVLHVKAAVIACNTVTAVCGEYLRARYDFPIVGAEPAVRPACRIGGEVLVLATCATCKSDKFLSLRTRCEAEFPRAKLVIHSCPQLAGEIERGVPNPDFDIFIHIPTMRPSAVVLGCTHYIYIKEQLQSYYQCPIFDGNLGISTRLSTVLQQQKQVDLSTKSQPFIHNFQKSRDNQPLFSTISLFERNSTKIYFLGKNAHHNRLIYEQTFAIPEK